MKIGRLLFVSFSLVVLSCCANAQTSDVLGSCGSLTIDVGGRHVPTMDSTGKTCVNATVSATATIAAFAPVGTNNAISVTSTTARTALTGAGTNSTTLVENSGATDVFVAFGDGTVTVTAANGTRVPAGWAIAFNIGAGTNIAYITASSTSTINATTGTGLPALGAAGSGGGSSAITTWAGGTLGAMANYGTSPGAVLVPGSNVFITGSSVGAVAGVTSSSGALGSMVNCASTTNPTGATTGNQGYFNCTPNGPVRVTPSYAGTDAVGDPCQLQTPTIKPISITTATTTNIVTGTAAKKLYVCYLYLQTVAANNIAVISGTTGATCGANTAALVGGTTAANGLNNAANSGQAFGNGGSSVMQVQTNNDDICIITSASTPLAGVIKYVVQ